MLVFSAVLPHSPLLVPSVGKEHRDALSQTLTSLQTLEEHLYATRPEVLIVISPHATHYPDAFSANLAQQYSGTLKEFGDHGTNITAKADFLFMDRLHRTLREGKIPFSLTSDETLDYGTTIPLLFLLAHLPTTKIVPLAVSDASLEDHAAFGAMLMQEIHAEPRRIALIASSDLSYHANAQSPKGASPAGAAFEQAAQQAVSTCSLAPLTQLSKEVLEEAEQCGAKPIAILLGAIRELKVKPVILSYEAPFGVGMLTAEFELL